MIQAQPRVPRVCFWEITDACDLRCVHCMTSAGQRAADELSTAEALALADQLIESGCQEVRLTGGEPTTRPDWPRLAKRLSSGGIKVTLITHGLGMDQARVAQLLAHGVTAVAVSVDGLQAVHDGLRLPAPGTTLPGSAHGAALDALELLSATPLNTAAITQIHRGNVDDLSAIYEQLAHRHVARWQVQLAKPMGRLLEYAHDYLLPPARLPGLVRSLAELAGDGRVHLRVADNIGYYGPHELVFRGNHWTGCQAGCQVVSIRSNGDVTGCAALPREFVIGNLRQESLRAIWDDAGRFAYNTAWDESRLVGGCARCAYRRVCRAGCTAMAYAVTGTVYDNPYCLQRAHER